jgi:tetratricopeptide (TPR) repeat protein
MAAAWKKAGLLVSVGVLAGVLGTPNVGYSQAEPTALLRDGNQAFRQGAYQEALEIYLRALGEGESNALLHYNLGVTHYKLGNYQEASDALWQATVEPKLAALAFYNLGLVSRAMGRDDQAYRWFRRAWQTTEDPRLETLATKAMVRTNPRETTGSAARIARDESPGRLILFATTRMGYDSNAYRTPDKSYVDIARPGQPTVTPVVQSGFYTPVTMNADLDFRVGSNTRYRIGYRFDGDFYHDSELQDANEYSHRMRLHADTVSGQDGPRKRSLTSDFYAGFHKETYFDPDDGLPRQINGEDISDRYSYWNAGLSAEFEQKLGWLGLGLRGNAELRDYEQVNLVPAYDHERYLLGGFTSVELGSATTLELGYDAYRRNYRRRPAYDLNGDLNPANPLLEYRYQSMGATATHRFGRKLSVQLDYRLIDREDQFVGYYDYTQHKYQLRTIFRPFRRLRTDLLLGYRTYDYPNAFAFNEPAGGSLDMDVLDGALLCQFILFRHISLWGEVRYRDIQSTDPRITYDRIRGALGVKWAL